MSGAITATVVMGAVSAYSSNQSAKAQNRTNEANAKLTREQAERRYRLEAGVSTQQMEEQNQMAMEKMTEVSRAFLQAKGQAKTVQAETGVGGNVAKRANAIQRTKASESKGKIAKEINTNVINVAQGMLASKIDTESVIAKANAYNKRSVGFETIMGGIQGGLQGYSIGSSLSKGTATDTTTNTSNIGGVTNTQRNINMPYTDLYFNR